MFRGACNVNIDAKGRLAIPARFREQLLSHCNGDTVVTVDTEEKCLQIYPLSHWDEVQKEVEQMPNYHPAIRRVKRLLIGHATDIHMDSSGRILLTPPLRDYAQLDKKGVLMGQGKRLELWSEPTWKASQDNWVNEQSSLEDLPPELQSLVL